MAAKMLELQEQYDDPVRFGPTHDRDVNEYRKANHLKTKPTDEI